MGEETFARKRVESFVWIRALACIAIVILHSYQMAVSYFAPDISPRIVSMIIRDNMLWAVPCFVMVSGALLLSPKHKISIDKIVKKYIVRMLIALLVFSAIFEAFDELSEGGLSSDFFGSWMEAVFTDGSWMHMWYIYLMIAIYLTLPIFRTFVKHAGKAEVSYILVALLIFQSIIPTILDILSLSEGFYMLTYTIYPLYLLLGFYIHSTKKFRITVPIAGLMVAVSIVIITLTTYFGIKYQIVGLVRLLSSYASVLVVMGAVGVFSLIDGIFLGRETDGDEAAVSTKPARIIESIDKCSFGIYLIHVLVINVIYRSMGFNPYEHGGNLMIALIALITMVVSYVVIYLLRLVKPLRRVL